jgi:hypothetical protein
VHRSRTAACAVLGIDPTDPLGFARVRLTPKEPSP